MNEEQQRRRWQAIILLVGELFDQTIRPEHWQLLHQHAVNYEASLDRLPPVASVPMASGRMQQKLRESREIDPSRPHTEQKEWIWRNFGNVFDIEQPRLEALRQQCVNIGMSVLMDKVTKLPPEHLPQSGKIEVRQPLQSVSSIDEEELIDGLQQQREQVTSKPDHVNAPEEEFKEPIPHRQQPSAAHVREGRLQVMHSDDSAGGDDYLQPEFQRELLQQVSDNDQSFDPPKDERQSQGNKSGSLSSPLMISEGDQYKSVHHFKAFQAQTMTGRSSVIQASAQTYIQTNTQPANAQSTVPPELVLNERRERQPDMRSHSISINMRDNQVHARMRRLADHIVSERRKPGEVVQPKMTTIKASKKTPGDSTPDDDPDDV